MKVPLYPNEDLRKRLEELGIPRKKHNLAELGEMLPREIASGSDIIRDSAPNKYIKVFRCFRLGDNTIFADTEANARAKMLIYLIENKLIDGR